ncbi:RNA-binding protein 7 [Silurus meridionalis]|nr:RNA-binding protein 7 [Silurus meridionalis]
MGIADEADRTLFVGNLDSQAGPLIKVKIPRDNDGNSKQFAFVNFKHEVSVPYSMHLLGGIRLYGRQLNLQFRAGSSHINQEGKSPANSQNLSPASTPTHRAARHDRTPDQMSSPSFSPPQNFQRSFASPDSLQKQAVRNNMWQVQMQQMQQLAGTFQLGMQQQQFRGGSGSSWQKDSPAPWNQRPAHQQDSAGHHGHGSGSGERHRRNDFYQHDDRSGGRNRDYTPDRRREPRDGRWRRY